MSLLDTLPPEIISEILIYGLADIKPNQYTYNYRRYVSMLCAVHQRLRIIAINTPALWTRISIDNPDDLCLATEMVGLLLARSGTLPLNIILRFPWAHRYDRYDGSALLAAATLLKSCYHRAETIFLEFGIRVDPHPFAGSLRGVKHVSLHMQKLRKDLIKLIKDCAPRSLYIINSNPNFVKGLNTKRLVHLHVRAPADILLLQKCQAVKWLKLDNGTRCLRNDTQLSLPRLRVAIIRGKIGSGGAFHFDAPLLEHLTVTSKFNVFCDFPRLRTITTSDHRVFFRLDEVQTVVAIRTLGASVAEKLVEWLLDEDVDPTVRFSGLQVLQIQLRGRAAQEYFLDTVERITRWRPDLAVEILFSDGDPGSVHSYLTLTSLKNVTILNAWDDLRERFRGEE